MGFSLENRQAVTLFYLFEMADGKITSDEKKKLNSICKKMEISADERKAIKAEITNIIDFESDSDNSDRVIQAIQTFLDEKSLVFLFGSLDKNKEKQVITLWNLINLGYSDKDFSEPEKKVVRYLIERWDVSNVIIQELKDSADTLGLLYEQKEWITTTERSEKEIDQYKRRIDKDIKDIADNLVMTSFDADYIG